MTSARRGKQGKSAAAPVAQPRGPPAPSKAAPPKKGESSPGGQAPGSNGVNRSRSGGGGGNAPKVSAPPPANPIAAENEGASPGPDDETDEASEAEQRNLLDKLPRVGQIVDVEVSRRAVQRLKPHIEQIESVDTFQVSVNVAAPFDSKIDIFPNPRRLASSQSHMRLQ